MKKEELQQEILKISKSHKINNDDFIKELMELVGPKKRVNKSSEFPNKLDDDNNIIEKYCIKIGEYLTIDNFNKSSKTKDGYSSESKIGLKIQLSYSNKIKKIESDLYETMDKVLEGEITNEEAKEIRDAANEEIAELKAQRLAMPYGMELYNEFA